MLTACLRRHIDVLAELIGERNTLRPHALESARGYLRRELAAMGHVVTTRWVRAIELSDHRGYWEQGFRALMITDTELMRNPTHHQPTDRRETLDLNRMTLLCGQLQKSSIGCAGRR